MNVKKDMVSMVILRQVNFRMYLLSRNAGQKRSEMLGSPFIYK